LPVELSRRFLEALEVAQRHGELQFFGEYRSR
jgi:hypothetical protein